MASSSPSTPAADPPALQEAAGWPRVGALTADRRRQIEIATAGPFVAITLQRWDNVAAFEPGEALRIAWWLVKAAWKAWRPAC